MTILNYVDKFTQVDPETNISRCLVGLLECLKVRQNAENTF